MNGTKATGKTIGEVENLTGIPKRDLKYYIEQDIMRPPRRVENGYWLYGEEDIQRARLASLCRELDFPVHAIRAVLADPVSHWHQELERHINRLSDRQDHTATQLHSAQRLLHSEVSGGLFTVTETHRRTGLTNTNLIYTHQIYRSPRIILLIA